MPPRTRTAHMPDDVSIALKLFRTEVLVETLRRLRVDGPSTCAQLCRSVGVRHPAMIAQLAELERAGLIEPQPDDQVVGGQIRTRWALREDELIAMASTVATYLTGLRLE